MSERRGIADEQKANAVVGCELGDWTSHPSRRNRCNRYGQIQEDKQLALALVQNDVS